MISDKGMLSSMIVSVALFYVLENIFVYGSACDCSCTSVFVNM